MNILKKVKNDKEDKLFQRWLYFAKIDADEKEVLSQIVII